MCFCLSLSLGYHSERYLPMCFCLSLSQGHHLKFSKFAIFTAHTQSVRQKIWTWPGRGMWGTPLPGMQEDCLVHSEFAGFFLWTSTFFLCRVYLLSICGGGGGVMGVMKNGKSNKKLQFQHNKMANSLNSTMTQNDNSDSNSDWNTLSATSHMNILRATCHSIFKPYLNFLRSSAGLFTLKEIQQVTEIWTPSPLALC